MITCFNFGFWILGSKSRIKRDMQHKNVKKGYEKPKVQFCYLPCKPVLIFNTFLRQKKTNAKRFKFFCFKKPVKKHERCVNTINSRRRTSVTGHVICLKCAGRGNISTQYTKHKLKKCKICHTPCKSQFQVF